MDGASIMAFGFSLGAVLAAILLFIGNFVVEGTEAIKSYIRKWVVALLIVGAVSMIIVGPSSSIPDLFCK